MTTVFLILMTFAYGLLVVIVAMRPPRPSLSKYELERRAKAGDAEAHGQLARLKLLPRVMALHRLWEFGVLTTVVILAIASFGLPLGGVVALTLVGLLGTVAKIGTIRRYARYCWLRHEHLLRQIVEKYPRYTGWFSGMQLEVSHESVRLYSRDELLDVIEQSKEILTKEEHELLGRTMAFADRKVREVMIPRKEIISINKDEILGPLTLTALHKVGKSHLPVVHGGLDHVIGIFAASEYMNTERQGEVKVENVMWRRIFYLNAEQTLHEAMHALLHTKAHLFIVVDNHEKTVGIITLSDIVQALFGRASKRQQYQQYEDVHAVASLSAAASQTSDSH